MEQFVLRLDALAEGGGLPATSARLAACHEAAAVSLEHHGHSPPANARVAWFPAAEHLSGTVEWRPAPVGAWNAYQQRERVEWAGEALTLATVRAVDSRVVLRRSETISGCDWMLVPEGESSLENAVHLEASGIDHASPSEVRARLLGKVEQVRRAMSEGRCLLDAIAGAAGLSGLDVYLQRIHLEVPDAE